MTSTVFDYEDISYSTPLRTAIQTNDKKLFISSLKSRASVRSCDNRGWTALHFAARFNRLMFMKLLLKKSHDSINIKSHNGKTPLAICSEAGSYSVLCYLLDQKNIYVNCTDNDKATALHLACTKGHIACVIALIDHGVSINTQDIVGLTPLHEAAANNHLDICQYLLSQKANPFIKDFFYDFLPFHYACQGGNLAIVNVLVEYMISDPVFNINMIAINNNTPLMLSIRSRNIVLIKELLKRGADANIATLTDISPLQNATSCGNIEIFKLIYEHTSKETIIKYFTLDDMKRDERKPISKQNLIIVATKANNFEYVKQVLSMGWEQNILDCPHVHEGNVYSPISYLIRQIESTNDCVTKQYVNLLLDSGCSLIPKISVEQPDMLNPLYICFYHFIFFPPCIMDTIYFLLKHPSIIDSLNKSRYKYFDMVIENSAELILILLQHSDVVEPEDLILHFHATITNKDNEIYKNTISMLLTMIPVTSDVQNIGEMYSRIPSLAVFCRQVIRSQLHKEAEDNYTYFRNKLTNLWMPQKLINFLNYSSV